MYKKHVENRLRQLTSKVAVSSVVGCLVLWGMRRLLRREWLRAVSCQNVTEGISSSVRSLLLNTFTSFGAAGPTNRDRTSRSALVDESMEPRAEESELPLPLQSKVLRHVSFFDIYDVREEEVLGTGMHGAVLVAKHRKSGRRVAAKCLDGADNGSLPDEVSLYLRLSHPNICRLLQAFVEKNGDIWLCMELCAGGELFELAAGTSSVVRQGGAMLDTEARIAVLVKQMAAAIRYIHSMGMVHRDIKLENWVFASPAQERLKLIDFGLATAYIAGRDGEGRKLNQMCGTCYYVAPEVIGLKDGAICKGDGYGQEVDIWALGVLIYMLVSGMPPFNGKSHADVIWNIANFKFCDDPLADAFVGPRWENVSTQCKDLIRRCMERDPQKRLTAAGVQVHPWLCQVGPQGPVAPVSLAPLLKDLCFAGNRMAHCGVLAHMCCSLASTIYLSPETWTEYKDNFAKLECLETLAPKGSLPVSKLVSAFEEAMANKNSELDQKPAELKDVDSFRAIAALDITGDGRLHFFEFLGAMIAAGRIQIHEHDVADVFAAFDVDRDNVISERDMASFIHHDSVVMCNSAPAGDKLQLPIQDHAVLLEALNRKPTWAATEQPQAAERPMTMPSPPSSQAAASGNGMQRLLSKAKLHMEWKVKRQVAFADMRSAVKLKSLNRGWRTPDPSPTRIDKESSPDNGAGLVGARKGGKMAQSMLTLTDLDKP